MGAAFGAKKEIPEEIPMKRTIMLGLVFFLCFSFRAQAQQSSLDFVLYDNFNQQFLSPAKWATSSPCFTWSVLECVREIQNGELRLAVRGYGAVNSNLGTQYGESELHFIKPTPIRSIATQLVVRRTSALGCPANPQGSHAHALLAGSFFNSGSGSATDDVQAFLIFDRFSTDPVGVLAAQAFMFWQGQFFGGVSLGTVRVGQNVIAQLQWDQANHQFLASWTDVDTGVVTQASMPYAMSDTARPAAPDKLMGVRAFTANCLGTKMLSVGMEATFDDVIVGR
jgi:hypothetical protein